MIIVVAVVVSVLVLLAVCIVIALVIKKKKGKIFSNQSTKQTIIQSRTTLIGSVLTYSY